MVVDKLTNQKPELAKDLQDIQEKARKETYARARALLSKINAFDPNESEPEIVKEQYESIIDELSECFGYSDIFSEVRKFTKNDESLADITIAKYLIKIDILETYHVGLQCWHTVYTLLYDMISDKDEEQKEIQKVKSNPEKYKNAISCFAEGPKTWDALAEKLGLNGDANVSENNQINEYTNDYQTDSISEIEETNMVVEDLKKSGLNFEDTTVEEDYSKPDFEEAKESEIESIFEKIDITQNQTKEHFEQNESEENSNEIEVEKPSPAFELEKDHTQNFINEKSEPDKVKSFEVESEIKLEIESKSTPNSKDNILVNNLKTMIRDRETIEEIASRVAVITEQPIEANKGAEAFLKLIDGAIVDIGVKVENNWDKLKSHPKLNGISKQDINELVSVSKEEKDKLEMGILETKSINVFENAAIKYRQQEKQRVA